MHAYGTALVLQRCPRAVSWCLSISLYLRDNNYLSLKGESLKWPQLLFKMSLEADGKVIEHRQMEAMKDEIVQMKKTLDDKSILNELLLRKFHEFKTNHEQMRQEFKSKLNGIEKEKGDFLRALQSQTDELVLRQPEKAKTVKEQSDKMIENQDKMKEYLERWDANGEQMKDTLELKSNQAKKILKQIKKQDTKKQNVELKVKVKSRDGMLEQKEKADDKHSKFLEEIVRRHYQQQKEEQIKSAAKTEKISDLEKYVKKLENCLAEKELEVWNVRQLLRDAGFQVANAIANILTKSAVQIEMRETTLKVFEKENEELREKQKVLVYESDRLQKEIEMLESQILDYKKVQADTAIINVTQAILDAANCQINGTQKGLCQTETFLKPDELSKKDMEKRWIEAKEERDLLIRYSKEITVSKNDFVQASNSLSEEVKLHDKRLTIVEEKFGDIENLRLQEKTRNNVVIDGVKSIDDKLKGIRDMMSEGKNRNKNSIQRFIARARNRSGR